MAALHADGAYIAFAAAPGQTASDNPGGRNGLFTKHLKEALAQSGLSIDDIFNNVREKVYRESNAGQRPFSTTGLVGRFYFREGPAAAAPVDVAAEAWNAVKDSGSANLLEAYVQEFPNSHYAGLARLRIAMLREPPPSTPSPAPDTARQELPDRVNPKDGLTYKYIPPGTFMMGCSPGDNECDNNEKPAKQVTIAKEFYLSRSEVTQAAYHRVTGKNPSSFKGPDRPVETVSRDEAGGVLSRNRRPVTKWGGVGIRRSRWDYNSPVWGLSQCGLV